MRKYTCFFLCFILLHLSISLADSFVSQELIATAEKEKSQTPEQQLSYLNEQIEQLEDERDRYKTKAAIAQNQGDRLQFESGMLSDARRYWKVAEACTSIANKIDEQIQILKEQRNQLLVELQDKK